MSKTQMQRDTRLTKENHPNNQQTYFLQNKTSLDYEQSVGKEYSKINVVEELSVPEQEDTLSTDSIYAEPSENLTASDFQDAICGEPMKQQIIRLDFNPVEGVDDNEEVLKKCHGFWEFLNGHPEMHHLKVMAEKHKPKPFCPLSGSEVSVAHHEVKDKTKIQQMSAIDWVNKEDIMTNAVQTLEQRRYCEHINEDYCDMRDSQQRAIATKKRRSRLASIKPPSTSKVNSTRSGGRSKSVSSSRGRRTLMYDVEDLVSQMKNWDLQHSRSLDPPHFTHEMSRMTVLRHDEHVDTEPVTRNESCCQLPCIPECPSAAETTNTEHH